MQITQAGSLSKTTHRFAVSILFFLQGICFSSWASRIPDIQQKLNLSEAQLGLVLFSIPMGLMISIPFSGWLIAKIGSHKVSMFALMAYSLSLATIGLSNSITHLSISLFFFGVLGNMSNIAINTQAVGVEAMYGRSVMASFHGMWSLAGFTGAFIGSLMIGFQIEPIFHFLMAIITVVLVLYFTAPYTIKGDLNKSSDPVFVWPERSIINLGIIAFCAMICEGAMFDWSGVYFSKVIEVEKSMTGVGYAAFMSTMASGRFIADWFTSKFGVKSTLQLSGLLTFSGLLLAVLFPFFVPALIGFLLIGFGVSSVVPLIYGAAGRSKKLSAGVAIAAVSTIGFLGFLVGPPIIGLVAGATSLRVSFSIIALMGLAVSIMSTILKHEEK